jgi:hypothetical protein
MLRVAAVLFWFTAVGFGVFVPPGIVHFVKDGTPLMVFGFPAYGNGPFERMGIKTSVPLLVAFLAVCLAEAVAGWLLWDGRRSGAYLGLTIIPAGALFWYGFALPIPPLVAVARTILIIVSWRALRP